MMKRKAAQVAQQSAAAEAAKTPLQKFMDKYRFQDVNEVIDGMTPLGVALKYGENGIVTDLLNLGADPKIKTLIQGEGITGALPVNAMVAAAYYGRPESFKAMLDETKVEENELALRQEATFDSKYGDQQLDIIGLCAVSNHPGIVEVLKLLLIDSETNQPVPGSDVLVETPDATGMSPFLRAVLHGNSGAVKVMCEAGADPHKAYHIKQGVQIVRVAPFLHVIAQKPLNIESTKAMIDSPKFKPLETDAGENNWVSLLMEGLNHPSEQAQRLDLIEKVINKNPQVLGMQDPRGKTVLEWSLMTDKYPGAFDLLLSRDGGQALNKPNYKTKLPPLAVAYTSNLPVQTAQLLDAGADPHCVITVTRTQGGVKFSVQMQLLELAISNLSPLTVKMVSSLAFNPSSTDKNGNNFVSLAMEGLNKPGEQELRLKVIETILERDPSVVAYRDSTAEHLTCLEWALDAAAYPGALALLIAADPTGETLNAVNPVNNFTPLQRAIKSGKLASAAQLAASEKFDYPSEVNHALGQSIQELGQIFKFAIDSHNMKLLHESLEKAPALAKCNISPNISAVLYETQHMQTDPAHKAEHDAVLTELFAHGAGVPDAARALYPAIDDVAAHAHEVHMAGLVQDMSL